MTQREEFGKVVKDLEVGEVFEIGGQLVQVESIEKILANAPGGPDVVVDVSMILTRIGAQNQISSMMLVCSEHTPITTIKGP